MGGIFCSLLYLRRRCRLICLRRGCLSQRQHEWMYAIVWHIDTLGWNLASFSSHAPDLNDELVGKRSLEFQFHTRQNRSFHCSARNLTQRGLEKFRPLVSRPPSIFQLWCSALLLTCRGCHRSYSVLILISLIRWRLRWLLSILCRLLRWIRHCE